MASFRHKVKQFSSEKLSQCYCPFKGNIRYKVIIFSFCKNFVHIVPVGIFHFFPGLCIQQFWFAWHSLTVFPVLKVFDLSQQNGLCSDSTCGWWGDLTKNGGQSVQGSRAGSTCSVAARAQIYETIINAFF